MEIKKSILYVIPSFIGNNEGIEHISVYNLKIINELKYFIVENEKKSRRFINKILPEKDQDSLFFFSDKKI